MSLGQRILATIGLMLACLIVILYVTSHVILRRSFANLETQDVQRQVGRALNAVSEDVSSLDLIALHWAAWDDTYAFMLDRNEGYVRSNLSGRAFTGSRLDVMVFIGTDGQVAYSRGFTDSREEISVPESLRAHVMGNSPLTQHAKVGILLLPEGPVLVALRPILSSAGEGPTRGTLLVGRYLDDAEIGKLSERTRLTVAVGQVGLVALPADPRETKAFLSGEHPIWVYPLDGNTIAGYGLVRDIYGQPALVLSVSMPRYIYRQGQISYVYLFSALLAVGLLCGGVTAVLLQKLVLARVRLLSQEVNLVSASHDLSARVTIAGEDELALLAHDVNDMLSELESFHLELRQSEERLRTVVQSMPAMMVAFDERGRIIAWNQECERVTGYSESEIVGNVDASSLLWPDAAYRNQMLAEWFARRYDYRDWEWKVACRDGSSKMVTWANISRRFPIPGWETWGIGLDITDRVRTREELEQHVMEQETLFAIGRLISSSLQVDQVMQSVAEHMAHLVDATCCVLSDWDAQDDTLVIRTRYLQPEQPGAGVQLTGMGQAYPLSSRPVVAHAIASRARFVVYAGQPGADASEQRALHHGGWSSVVGIPIIALEQVIGLAEVCLPVGAPPFSEHDLRLLQSLVDQIAVAIHNARLFSVVQANEGAMRDLSLRLINAQEQERHRIAQELHDELGQLMTAIKINVDLARRRLSGQEPLLRQRLDEASSLTDRVLTNVRALTVDLRPTLLDDMGIVPTLRWYLKRFAQRTSIEVYLDAPELPCRLRPEIETTIYRVSQEALTNVARHAQAHTARVHMACANGTVMLSVEDDGQGFDVEAWSSQQSEQPSLGLTGIQERVMLLDGQVSFDSRPGHGTRVQVTLPARFRDPGGDSDDERAVSGGSCHRPPRDQGPPRGGSGHRGGG